jgi:3-oxosteroid 1-dehydrogenase
MTASGDHGRTGARQDDFCPLGLLSAQDLTDTAVVNRSCDLLCVGGGLGGLAAATRAHALGLEPLILERSDLVGGISAYGAGGVWAPCTALARAAGVQDSLEDAVRYLDWYSGNEDVPLREGFVRAIAPAIDWFTQEAGIPFTLLDFPDEEMEGPGARSTGRQLQVQVPGASLGPWQQRTRVGSHFPIGLTLEELFAMAAQPARLEALSEQRQAEDLRTLGPGLVAGFVRAALTERLVPITLGARVVELVQCDGEVVGAIADVGGERMTIEARRGVLIATGSYGHAPWVAELEGIPEMHDGTPPIAEGDNLTLTDPTPAAMIRGGNMFATAGVRFPGEYHPGTDHPLYRQLTNSSWSHTIVVNASGRRFGDETFHGPDVRTRAAIDPVTRRWRNFPFFLIADDRFRRDNAFGPYPAGADWPEEFARADDLRTLAGRLGVDPDGLQEEVQRFNGFAARGVDEDFRRGRGEIGRSFGDERYPNPSLTDLTEPPFWGIPLSLTNGGLYSFGIAINPHGQALTRTGAPVPGLYVTGNAAARLDVPRYHSGMADARNLTYAFLAATHAAAH